MKTNESGAGEACLKGTLRSMTKKGASQKHYLNIKSTSQEEFLEEVKDRSKGLAVHCTFLSHISSLCLMSKNFQNILVSACRSSVGGHNEYLGIRCFGSHPLVPSSIFIQELHI